MRGDTEITFDIMRDETSVYRRLKSFRDNPEHDSIHVFLEKAQCMPGNGLVSMFNYGVHFGHLEGFLIALEIPYTLVSPHVWAKEMHEGASHADRPKDKSRQIVKRLFPTLDITNPDNPRARTAHEGIMDALLIAEYGRRRRSGGSRLD